ncbi:hypothetical protein SISSUDRAFT_1125969 [Sistotremastrum suecicum HHB10207 ss-3]|uniref:Nucleoporin Nup133/Nup155-like C-terminal domain-containing protein n=1 Tax=Sistotremastrum suecicum HHB10207 ss-3 TaxID=1314776 RepID=A0A166GUY1_9AGAM|nr:hypothetical protein SISSUDRAFT_1125969 [Sistotremastrum suecicum HHB10207 ss-3]
MFTSTSAPHVGRVEQRRVSSKTGLRANLSSSTTQSEDGDVSMEVDNQLRSMDTSGISDRDEDDSIANIYAKSGEMVASFYSFLPPELQVLRNADFYHEEYKAYIDPATSHTVLISPTTTWVWRHGQNVPSTCYIFPTPASKTSGPHSASGCLVPNGNREPGLLLISPSGEARFWDSLSYGLSGAERFYTAQVLAPTDGIVSGIYRYTDSTYIVVTTASLPYRLTIVSSLGKYSIRVAAFQRQTSYLSRVTSIFSASTSGSLGAAVSVAFGKVIHGSRTLWLLLESALQQWQLSEEGFEKMVHQESHLIELIAGGLAQFDGVRFKDFHELDIELLDLNVLKSSELVLLIAFTGRDDPEAQPQRKYALVKLVLSGERGRVTQVQAVPYRNRFDLGATSPCRLIILRDRFAVIHFGDSVALTALNGKYNTLLPLRSHLDRFLSVTLHTGVEVETEELIALNATGLMSIRIDLDAIARGDPHTREAGLLQNIMNQAILYGPLSHNPLQFTFPPQVDEGSLVQGAEALSRAVLESLPEVDKQSGVPLLDLSSQLGDRVERLHLLIDFIGANEALTSLSQDCRLTLASDAEKMFAAEQLWLWHNSHRTQERQRSVLVDAILLRMREVPHREDADLVRDFFRYRVGDLPELLNHLVAIVKSTDGEDLEEQSQVVADANDVASIIIREAFRHRRDFEGPYRLDTTWPADQCPWTAESLVLQALDIFLAETDALLEEHSRRAGLERAENGDLFHPADVGLVLKSQSADLARFIFSCCRQRQIWLRHANRGNREAERDNFEQEFSRKRRTVFQSLVRHDNIDTAYDLAETYGDFRNLAELCHDPKSGDSERTKNYIERYGEAYTMELYQFYVERHMLQAMFQQEERFSPYIDKFFAEHPQPRLSWIQDLRKERFGQAAESLLEVSEREPCLAVKHVMLSMGYLAQLSEMDAEGEDPEKDQPELETELFDAGLDLVSVQELLAQEFQDILAQEPFTQSSEVSVLVIMKKNFSNVQDRSGMAMMIRRYILQVLQGQAVEEQDIIDLISSRDHLVAGADFVSAIKLVQGFPNMTDSTKDIILRGLWRKAFIHDDWQRVQQTAGLTDNQINNRIRATALYATLRAITDPSFDGWRLTPTEASQIPSFQSLGARWPTLSSDQLKEIETDLKKERDRLETSGIKRLYDQVMRLAVDDQASLS